MSWGTRIAILYGGFVVLILGLVYRTSIENAELESPDYYAKELKFQDEIDATSAVMQSGVAPTLGMDEQYISLEIPPALCGDGFHGSVTFYRADDASKDRVFNLVSGSTQFDRGKFTSGNYEVRVNWNSAGQNYYHETEIHIP